MLCDDDPHWIFSWSFNTTSYPQYKMLVLISKSNGVKNTIFSMPLPKILKNGLHRMVIFKTLIKERMLSS